jgi:hypothetical protein
MKNFLQECIDEDLCLFSEIDCCHFKSKEFKQDIDELMKNCALFGYQKAIDYLLDAIWEEEPPEHSEHYPKNAHLTAVKNHKDAAFALLEFKKLLKKEVGFRRTDAVINTGFYLSSDDLKLQSKFLKKAREQRQINKQITKDWEAKHWADQ